MGLRWILFVLFVQLYDIARAVTASSSSERFLYLRNKVDKIDNVPIFEFGEILESILLDKTNSENEVIVSLLI